MHPVLKTILIILSIPVGLLAVLFIYFSLFYTEPSYILDPTRSLEGVTIQPARALELAEPYLAEHATIVYRDAQAMKTHLLRLKKWYYVQRTDYPAKTFRYYMQPAVMVHVDTGEIRFAVRK